MCLLSVVAVFTSVLGTVLQCWRHYALRALFLLLACYDTVECACLGAVFIKSVNDSCIVIRVAPVIRAP